MTETPVNLPAPPAVGGFARLLRYLHTVRHLRPGQLGWYVVRRGLPQRRRAGRPDLGGAREGLVLPAPCAPVVPAAAPGGIRFLNDVRPFDPARVDWRAADAPKLWRYNLHYFDYLRWPHWDEDTRARLIDSWIAGNPPGRGDGWEPYTVSLRTVNWIRFMVATGRRPATWVGSLAEQVAWLEGQIEFHILANHLVKNAKALVFGGAWFAGAGATRRLRRGLDILAAQAGEQFLGDGGHFERSPMYHAIVLEDYLDVVGLIGRNPGLAPAATLAPLRAAAERGLAFLAGIRAGDGAIPLFNDAAFGIAPPPGALLDYGERVLGQRLVLTPGRRCIEFPATGYFGYAGDGESFIIDCGPVGPDYQPGHAHCDTLSYELCLDGRRMIVDSGTYDYEAGPLRTGLRGTAAHNTLQVDGAEQSEVWGAFRVARRARPLGATLLEEGAKLVFQGAHDGYRRLAGAPVHAREVRMEPGRRWAVRDTVTGRGRHVVRSFVHLHPDLALAQDGDAWTARHPGGPAIRVVPSGRAGFRAEAGCYCPEFGVRHTNRVLVMEAEGALPLQVGYDIERLDR